MSQELLMDSGGQFVSDFFSENNFTLGEAIDFQSQVKESFKRRNNIEALIATGELISDLSIGLSFMTGGGLGAGRAVSTSRITAKGLGNSSIQFGRTLDQINHTFRHTDKLGLSRMIVKSSVEKNLKSISHKILTGKPFNQTIKISGKRVQYTAFKLENGTINIGRIHGI
ncbi:hypothetical protein [Peijinzhouia sedimentorum]